MNKKYYSAWDVDAQTWFHSGYNCESWEECAEQVLSILTQDWDDPEDDVETVFVDLKGGLSAFGIRVEEHEGKLPGD